MAIQLSDHFTYRKLFRFTLPSVIMMIFTSVYGVVDGFFVSNFVGKTPFAAVNFIMPFLMILGALGFMIGTGGSALVSKTLGEGDEKKARELFSMFVYVSLLGGIVFSVIGISVLRPVAALLGAEGELLDNCVIYGRIILIALPAFILQYEFQSFFVTAEKPHLGLAVTVAAGVTNMVLDALLCAVFPMGLAGAAIATALSQCIGGFFPLIYFLFFAETGKLRLTRTVFKLSPLIKACANGSSELLSTVSMSLVGMLYNAQLMKFAGEDGVAAYGVLMYVNMIFLAIFIGYSVGTAPVIGYNYGAERTDELHSIFVKSLKVISCTSLIMVAAGLIFAYPLSGIFVGYDRELFEMTLRGFRIYSFAFLFSGMAIFGSSFFTALNNGLISAVISFMRTLIFQVAAVIIFPLIWELDGIWASVVAAEFMAFSLTVFFLVKKRGSYRY